MSLADRKNERYQMKINYANQEADRRAAAAARDSEIRLQEARDRANKSEIESLRLKIELKKLEMMSQGGLAPQGDGSMSGAGGEPL